MKTYKGYVYLESRNGIFDGIQKIYIDELNVKLKIGEIDMENAFANYYKRIREEVDLQTYFDYCCWEQDYLPNHKATVYINVTTVFESLTYKEFEPMWKKAVKEWENVNK